MEEEDNLQQTVSPLQRAKSLMGIQSAAPTAPVGNVEGTTEAQVVDGGMTPLQRAKSLMGVAPVTSGTTPAASTTALPDFSKLTYSESDLTRDDFYPTIENYLTDRYGEYVKETPREKVVEWYTNHMRGFNAGNSIRVGSEVAYIASVNDDEEKLARAGAAFELYDKMQGIGGETTWGEKAEIATDYARSIALDPLNLTLIFGGKLITGAGSAAGTTGAKIAARAAYKKLLAKGMSEEAAQKGALKLYGMKAAALAANTQAKIAQREAIAKSATTLLQRVTSPIALKEAATVGGLDAAVSAGIDYLQQDVLMATGVQEDYDKYKTGMAAVVGLVAGGASAMASNVGTGTTKAAVGPSALKTTTANVPVGKAMANVGTPSKVSAAQMADFQATQAATAQAAAGGPKVVKGDWLKDIAKGRELTDQDTEFFIELMMGNDELGVKGMAQSLLEEGYVWKRRGPDDKISNWLGDILKQADPVDGQKFLDEFSMRTGIDMVDGKSLTMDAFVGTFKLKMSESGQLLNRLMQLSKILGRKVDTITGNDYLEVLATGALPEAKSLLATTQSLVGKKLGKKLGDFVDRDLPNFQDNLVRLMVSNLSTTRANVEGYATATALNSATDVAHAALLGGKAGLALVYDPKAAKELGLSAKAILQAQLQKARNLLDPNATVDAFYKYAAARPEAMRELTQTSATVARAGKNLDLDSPLAGLGLDRVTEFIQKGSLVDAQDTYTKAFEFYSQLDKNLRLPVSEGGFGKSWAEFFADPDHHKYMLTENFVRAEARAVDETLRATFSKSFKGKGFIGELAGAIEDFRRVPVIGMLVPFGRFFNNTVAFAYQGTVILPLMAKFMGKGVDKPMSEIAARGFVTFGLLQALVPEEMKFMDMGLNWSEAPDRQTGEIKDYALDWPSSGYKAVARLIAYHWKDQEVPKELLAQMGDQFVTSTFKGLGEAGVGLGGLFSALIAEDGPELSKVLRDSIGGVVSQTVSAGTRFAEPYNYIVGLGRGEDFYLPDRKQGSKVFNDGIRYLDQFYAVLSGEDVAPEKYTAAEGKPELPVTKFFSTSRRSRLTNVERVLNAIGKPEYLLNYRSLSPAADNRLNQVSEEIMEGRAGRLFASKAFQNGDLETRQLLYREMVGAVREDVLGYMGRIATNSDDPRLLKIFEISKKGQTVVSRVLEDLGTDKTLDEMSYEELDQVFNAIQFRDEVLREKMYRTE